MLRARSCDVGYGALPLPQHKLSVVGGRPFSKARLAYCCALKPYPLRIPVCVFQGASAGCRAFALSIAPLAAGHPHGPPHGRALG